MNNKHVRTQTEKIIKKMSSMQSTSIFFELKAINYLKKTDNPFFKIYLKLNIS